MRSRLTEASKLDVPFSPPKHRPAGYQPRADRRHRYDLARGAEHSKWYGRRWQKLRAAYLAQHPLCACGCNRPAEVVHHVKAHRGDADLLYAWDNLQALTKACHDRITGAGG